MTAPDSLKNIEPVELKVMLSTGKASNGGLARHIYATLRAMIMSGAVVEGAMLPSSRAAADALGVSRNTLNTAYDLLRSEGLLDISPNRRPRIVALNSVTMPKRRSSAGRQRPIALVDRWVQNYRQTSVEQRSGLFAPGCPDHKLFPADSWARALRRAARHQFSHDRSLREMAGLPELREALAFHLKRERGLSATPEQILITAGTQASLALLASVAGGPGATAWVEDPNYLGATAAFEGAGMIVERLPLDREGAIVPADRTRRTPRLIYLTPSNQYPTGCRMTLRRRQQFIERARSNGALVIEDDYDTEFHWRGGVIPAMHALGAESVAYLGTTSKTMMIGLQLGWMVVPQDIATPLAQALVNMGLSANVHAQAALCDFMASGEYNIQVRRISRTYAERGALLSRGLKRRLKGRIHFREPDGGLQLALTPVGEFDEVATLERLQASGFTPGRLSLLSANPETRGLVIGFADATPANVDRFCEVLSQALL